MAIDPTTYYKTVDNADAYFSEQLYADDWVNGGATDKEKAILAGSRAVDSLQYRGEKKTVYDLLQTSPDATAVEIEAAEESQVLQFPRDEDGDFGGVWVQEVGGLPAGTFTLVFNGETTSAIDSASVNLDLDILAALEGLSNMEVGDVTVVAAGSTNTITLAGQYAKTVNNVMVIDDVLITNGFATLTMVSNWGIPDAIFWAVCEEAKQLLASRDPEQEFNNLWLTTDGVGSTRASFDRSGMPQRHTSALLLSAIGFKYLQRYLEPNNTFEVRRS